MVRLHALVPIDLPGNPRKAKFQRRLEVGFQDVFPWTVVVGLHGRWTVQRRVCFPISAFYFPDFCFLFFHAWADFVPVNSQAISALARNLHNALFARLS